MGLSDLFVHEFLDNWYKSKGCFADHSFDTVFESVKCFQVDDVHDAVRVQVNHVQEMIQITNRYLSTFPCWLVCESKQVIEVENSL